MSDRIINKKLIIQGKDESIRYSVDVTNWGINPANIVITATDVTDPDNILDVSESVLDGDPSTEGNVITLPLVKNILPGHIYYIEVRFFVVGNTYEPFLIIKGEN